MGPGRRHPRHVEVKVLIARIPTHCKACAFAVQLIGRNSARFRIALSRVLKSLEIRNMTGCAAGGAHEFAGNLDKYPVPAEF
jgi:hypothetical protein